MKCVKCGNVCVQGMCTAADGRFVSEGSVGVNVTGDCGHTGSVCIVGGHLTGVMVREACVEGGIRYGLR